MDKDQAAMLTHLTSVVGVLMDTLRHRGVLTRDDCRFVVHSVAELVPDPSPSEDEFFTALLRRALDQPNREPPTEDP